MSAPGMELDRQNASSGCVRLMNQYIINLYERVAGKTTIIVRDPARPDLGATSGGRPPIPIDAGVPRDAELLV